MTREDEMENRSDLSRVEEEKKSLMSMMGNESRKDVHVSQEIWRGVSGVILRRSA